MTLICDCGSTKAEWAILDGNNVANRFITNGFNPNFTDGGWTAILCATWTPELS